MSGGEQQMLAIGRGLMAEPRLLILDEPSLGLSPLLVEELFALIARLHAEGPGRCCSSSRTSRSRSTSRSARYVLENGAIRFAGTPTRCSRATSCAAPTSDSDDRDDGARTLAQKLVARAAGRDERRARRVRHLPRRPGDVPRLVGPASAAADARRVGRARLGPRPDRARHRPPTCPSTTGVAPHRAHRA